MLATARTRARHRLRSWLWIPGVVVALGVGGCQRDGVTSPGEGQGSPDVYGEDGGGDGATSGGINSSTTSVAPWRSETFTTYGGSTANWKSDPHDWMVSAPSWFNQNRITLDTKNLYNGHPTLRYDWPGPAAGGGWGGCNTNPAISAAYWAPTTREMWIEVAHKFRSDFNDKGPGCNYGAYKFLLFLRAWDRFDIRNGVNGYNWWSASPQKPGTASYNGKCSSAGVGESCRWGYGSGQLSFLSSLPGRQWDGQWHVYRIHIRLPATKGNTDGVYEVWVDGRKTVGRYNRNFIDNGTGYFSNRITQIQLGSNSNSGTLVATKTWWADLKIWTSNPGW